MVTTPNPPITALLADLQAGDEDAREAVAGWLYPRLREMAGTEMGKLSEDEKLAKRGW